jgi:hypothetical protein
VKTLLAFLSLVSLFSLAASAVDIEITPLVATGPRVQRWGWDLKAMADRLDTPAEAQKLYGDLPANLVRFPIFADAHFQNGTVDEASYAKELTSLGQIFAVNPNVEIFASIKLQGVDTFPAWVQSTVDGSLFGTPVKKPLPVEYGRLIADFVSFMAGKGYTIHYVGPGNETGQCLTPDRFGEVATNLKSQVASRGLPVPKIVGPCTFSLSSSGEWDTATSFLSTPSAREQIDIVSSHFYPQYTSGFASDWQTLSTLSGGKPMWHTEIHTAAGTSSDLQQVYRDSLAVIFTSNLNGVDSFVHWATGHNDDLIAALIKRHEMRTMVGSTPCSLSAPLFTKGDPQGTPLYQSYYNATDGHLYLWVANPGASTLSVKVSLTDVAVAGPISSIWWQGNNTTLDGTNSGTQPATVAADKRSFTATFKDHAVTVVTIPITGTPVAYGEVVSNGNFSTPVVTGDDVYGAMPPWRNSREDAYLRSDSNQGGKVPGPLPNTVTRLVAGGEHDDLWQILPHRWAPTEVYYLTFNAIEVWFKSGNSGNTIRATLEETGGTVLWDSGALNLDGTHPNTTLATWPANTYFRFLIPGSAFASVPGATPGGQLLLRFHAGTNAHSINQLDNVSLLAFPPLQVSETGISGTNATRRFWLRWPSIAGGRYKVQRKLLMGDIWTNAQTAVSATPPFNTFTDPAPMGEKAFYRVDLDFP